MATPTPRFTVAVCTRNRVGPLRGALESLLPQLDQDSELLVVDNGSTDATPELLANLSAQHPAKLRSHREDRPGFSPARNAALRQARGEFVIFFDDDELAEPGWLAAYQKFLSAPPTARLGCVGGPYEGVHAIPTPPWIQENYGTFDHGLPSQALTGKSSLASGNSAYPRALVLKLGGFTEGLHRREDSELNERLRRAGYELWWLPEARVKHVIPAARFGFRSEWRAWFTEGRAVVGMRANLLESDAARFRFLLTRLLVSPFQFLLQCAGSVLFAVLCNKRRAFRLCLRGALALGVIRESAKRLLAGRPKPAA